MSVTLTDLHVYPIKSCRGIALRQRAARAHGAHR